MISWCPYAFLGIYNAFVAYIFNLPEVPATLATVSAFFAKLSLVWPAIWYIALQNTERKKFINNMREEGSIFLKSVRKLSLGNLKN